jgi:hypothetical protein
MPSSRKHPRYSSSDGASPADTCKSGCGEFPTDAPRTEAGDFIDQTTAIWQRRTERKLTREDGREIIENISGFFSILQEWERKERGAECAGTAASSDSKARCSTRQSGIVPRIGPPSSRVKMQNQS